MAADVGSLISIGFSPQQAKHLGCTFQDNITAAGTVQGDATALTESRCHVTTGSANQGVRLPSVMNVAAQDIVVRNSSGAALMLYPATGESIDELAANNSVTLGIDKSLHLFRISSTKWISLGR